MTGVFIRERRGTFRQSETVGRQPGKTGRNWSDAATSQGVSRIASHHQSLQEGAGPS